MSYPVSYLKTKLYAAFYKTVLFRLGFGGRVGKDVWEKEYSGTSWDFLFSEDEQAHYDGLIKQIGQLGDIGDLLDIGCGEGVLYDYMTRSLKVPFIYHGIDISETAIRKGKEKHTGIDFKVCDFDYERVDGKFKLIIFNEVLYYFIKPIKTLQKAAADNLHPDGVMLLSMCEDPGGRNTQIWKNIDAHFKTLRHDIVRNSKGWVWNIKTVVPLNPVQTV
ncbi:MAG TPA: class I SAM-dependent methyltransferase [Mucilaginibacter sp.]|jgi:2-polyprenyl-3-methyl-5-hydroxy-6-metoxy-1,4-benzoquinol methylase|nr:class I SAM-dependent methyltransferase [Mucilaginibacter sp.]